MSGTTPTTAPVASPSSVLPEVPRLPDRLVDQLAFPSRASYTQMVAAFTESVADGELRVFEHSGHFPYLEEPDDYRQLVTEFVLGHCG